MLKDIIAGIDYIEKRGNFNKKILNLSCTVENTQSKTLYFCYKGVKNDGHKYFRQAMEKGAVAFVVEEFVDADVPQLKVKNCRKAMAKISQNFYGNPQQKLKMLGVTGTNGKTSTTYILEKILQKSNKVVGVIGTNGIRIGDEKLPSILTTPDPIELYKTLAYMVSRQVEYVVMEVSAHAVALHKLEGLDFEVGGFTNLTQDHLDFFETMENYAQAKLDFLSTCRKVVINIDDSFGHRFYKVLENKVSYSLSSLANFEADSISMSIKGSRFIVKMFNKKFKLKSNLVGLFNIQNILCAVAIADCLDIPRKSIVKGVRNIYVEGRFNVIHCPKKVIIDYAHTPDGLKNILLTAQQVCKGRIITVFGCGGNRDRTKRSLMGKVVSELSDLSIVTSDNPRLENPQQIIEDIKEGVVKDSQVLYEVDRKTAIKKALDLCRKHDWLLICGKGHEPYQDINGVKYAYSDYNEVAIYFQKRGR